MTITDTQIFTLLLFSLVPAIMAIYLGKELSK